MNITKISEEFAKDLIVLVNSLKKLTYNAEVDFTNKKGQRTHFKYITLDKICETCKENPNIAVMTPLGTNEQGRPAVQVILLHRTGEALVSDYYVLELPNDGSKQYEGAAITYTKRYAIGSFLCISTDENNDAGTGAGGIEIKDWRKRFIELCVINNINFTQYAATRGIDKTTTQARFKQICEEIERGTQNE